MVIVAQIIGIFAMAFAILSFQQRTPKKILLMQFCASVLFTAHYFLKGAFAGAIMNIIAFIRAIVFSNQEKCEWAKSKSCAYLFCFLFVLVYPFEFLVLKTYNDSLASYIIKLTPFFVESLPVIGSVFMTFSFRLKDASKVRLFYLLGSPLWLIYNIVVGSIGGTLTESFDIVSIIIAYFRLDRNKKTDKLQGD